MSKPADIVARQNIAFLTIRRVICYIVLVLLSALALVPFLFLIINTTRGQAEIALGFSLIPSDYFLKNFQAVLNQTNFPILVGMRNSLFVAAVSSAICVYFSAFTAYGIHVYDFKGKKAIYTFILMVMMVPTQVSTLGFLDMITKWGLMSTFWPLIIPAVAAPAVMFFMKQYMEASLPLEIVEAARIDGCNEFRTFNTIIAPILKPAFAVQAIFAFVGNWNNYFIPQLILEKDQTKTLPVLIALVRSASKAGQLDLGRDYMYITLSIVPVVLVYLFLSKFIIRGVTLGAVKG